MGLKGIKSLREHAKSGTPETHFSEAMIQAAEKIAWDSDDISFKAVRKFATENFRKLGEANPGSAFSQLFRAGVQVFANGWYERTAIEYTAYVAEMSSNKRQEFHAPLYGADFPDLVEQGDPYNESRIVGIDRELVNQKYMGGESFTREMFDDDQTGQIKTRMQRLGESSRLREELEAAGRLNNTALTQGKVTVPLTTYQRTNSNGATVGVYATNFYGTIGATAYGNRPAVFAQLSMSTLRVALQSLGTAFDPLGVRIAVRPDRLVVSNFDDVNARTLLNSSYYPGVPGLAGQTAGGATSGSLTGGFADNVLKGMLNLSLNTFLPFGAWNVGASKKGMVMQRRDALEVVQEQPNSGASFNTDTIRFRSRARWVLDWIDSSFWYQGNDGSAVVSQ